MESNEKEVITSENVNNYIGKRVTTWQLDNVYGLYIRLTDVEVMTDLVGECYVDGTLSTISKTRIGADYSRASIIYNEYTDDNCEVEYNGR